MGLEGRDAVPAVRDVVHEGDTLDWNKGEPAHGPPCLPDGVRVGEDPLL